VHRRGSPLVVLALLACSALLTGCSGLGNPEGGNARSAVQRFQQAVQGDPAAACGLLAPRTRKQLEDTEGPCEQALPEQDLPEQDAGAGSGVTSVDVYGKDAIAHVGDDTVFLARFEDGWRVTAAGCTPVPDRPYDCELEGS
jgi:hypothetical protein